MWLPTSKLGTQKAFPFGFAEVSECIESLLKQTLKKKKVHHYKQRSGKSAASRKCVSKTSKSTKVRHKITKQENVTQVSCSTKRKPCLQAPPVSQFQDGFKAQCVPFNQKDYCHKIITQLLVRLYT
jgi:hypothetical protein